MEHCPQWVVVRAWTSYSNPEQWRTLYHAFIFSVEQLIKNVNHHCLVSTYLYDWCP